MPESLILGLGEVVFDYEAQRLLHAADVVIYDRLVSREVLDLARREANYIYVGKDPAGASTRQEEINRLMVHHAQQGSQVVRLKSGDPLVFGRADEESGGKGGEGGRGAASGRI